MVPLVPLTNFGFLVFMAGLLWVAVPLPPGNRLYMIRMMFDASGVGRLGARLTGLVIVAGVVAPAALGLAPVNSWPPEQPANLPGMVYVPFVIGGLLSAAGSIGLFRLRRRLARSPETDLHAPPTEGPALVTATVRDPDADGSDEERDDAHIVHDYRDGMLIRVGIWEECESLKRADPFVLEGPGGSIDVDTTDAHVAAFERDVEDRRIGDGDQITVLGTVRVDQTGRFSMSGSEDFLYLTSETRAEFRSRSRKAMYAIGLLTSGCLLVAGWSLNALVGFA